MARNPLSAILDSNKLDGKNYSDWFRNLKIVLDSERRTYVLTQSPPDVVPDESTQQEIETIQKWKDDDLQARCLILASMTSELQKQHEHMRYAADIILHLKELYEVQDRSERYAASKELFGMRMAEGTDVHDHGVKMLSLIEKLGKLDLIMDNELLVDLVLQSLPPSFGQFILNFNMNKIEASVPELINMLKTAQSTMVKGKTVLIATSKPSKSKKGRKGKKTKGLSGKGGVAKKTKTNQKADKCFHCGETGHWKRNCKAYISTLTKDGAAKK